MICAIYVRNYVWGKEMNNIECLKAAALRAHEATLMLEVRRLCFKLDLGKWRLS